MTPGNDNNTPHVGMRRKDRELQECEVVEILNKCEYGVLACLNANSDPYATPLSYVLHDNSIYFHCAYKGHKLNNIMEQPKVSFAVVGNVERIYYPGDGFSTLYESAIVFGKASIVEDEQEKTLALKVLTEKYFEGNENIDFHIKADLSRTCVVKISIEHKSGKANRKKQRV